MGHKICRNCGAKVESKEPFCDGCMGTDFISENSEVTIIDKDSREDYSSQTVIETKKTLKFLNSDFELSIENQTIVGRESFGSKYISSYQTVSRKHLKVIFKDEKWYIIDMNSSNGTYLNGKRIDSNIEYEINDGDKINLSTKLELIINII
jgi:pSer/pThr/pTyr-binding forkhead associated (FHA) protein